MVKTLNGSKRRTKKCMFRYLYEKNRSSLNSRLVKLLGDNIISWYNV